jgi:hypothetical protein
MSMVQVFLTKQGLERVFEAAKHQLGESLIYSAKIDFDRAKLRYRTEFVVRGGQLSLGDNGVVTIRELDLQWPSLVFSLAFDLPKIDVSLALGPIPILPADPIPRLLKINHTLFDTVDDLIFHDITLTTLLSSEISAVGQLMVEHSDQSWVCDLRIQQLDLDFVDFEALFGGVNGLLDSSAADPLEHLLTNEMNRMIDTLVFKPKYLSKKVDKAARQFLRAGIATFDVLKNPLKQMLVGVDQTFNYANLLNKTLELGDDIGEWLADKFEGPIGLRNLIYTLIADRLTESLSFRIDDPLLLLPALETQNLSAVKIDLKDIELRTNRNEIAVSINF